MFLNRGVLILALVLTARKNATKEDQ